MKLWLWMIVGVLFAAGLAVGVPFYLESRRKGALLARCNGLRAQIATLRTQGGDVSEAQRLEAQLALCLEEAKASGVEIDAGAVTLGLCDQLVTQIDQEWAAYRSTMGEDALKRNNARGQVLRLGDELLACLRSRLGESETPEALRALRAVVTKALASSRMRLQCLKPGSTGPGCSRWGVNEPDQSEKYEDERRRIAVPLATLLSQVGEKLARVDQDYAAQRARAADAARDYERLMAARRGARVDAGSIAQ